MTDLLCDSYNRRWSTQVDLVDGFGLIGIAQTFFNLWDLFCHFIWLSWHYSKKQGGNPRNYQRGFEEFNVVFVKFEIKWFDWLSLENWLRGFTTLILIILVNFFFFFFFVDNSKCQNNRIWISKAKPNPLGVFTHFQLIALL